MLCEAKCTVLHFAIFEIQKKREKYGSPSGEVDPEKQKNKKIKEFLLVEFL